MCPKVFFFALFAALARLFVSSKLTLSSSRSAKGAARTTNRSGTVSRRTPFCASSSKAGRPRWRDQGKEKLGVRPRRFLRALCGLARPFVSSKLTVSSLKAQRVRRAPTAVKELFRAALRFARSSLEARHPRGEAIRGRNLA